MNFSTVIAPRFYETDALGHINNIAVMAWFEVARTRLLDLVEPGEKATEKGWVMATVTVDYLDEMFYGSDVTVSITDVVAGNSSLSLSCEMHQDERLAVKGKAVLVRLDLETKVKMRVSDSVREALARL